MLQALTLAALVALSSGALASTLSGTAFCGNSPMVGATIEAITDATQQSAGSSETSASGGYTLTLVNAAYDLVVTPPAGSPCAGQTIQNHVVSGDETYDIILFVVDPGDDDVTVSGTVTGLGGAAAAGLSLYIYGGSVGYHASTDQDGHYSVKVPKETYTFYLDSFDGGAALPESMSCSFGDVVVAADTVFDLAFPVVTVGGTVAIEPAGTPLANVHVSLSASGQVFSAGSCSSGASANTGSDGTYGPVRLLGGVHATASVGAVQGEYTSATAGADLPTEGSVVIDLAPEVDETLFANVSGTITGLDGHPISGVSIYWYGANGSYNIGTDANGHYAFEAVPGTYQLYLDALGSGAYLPESVSCSSGGVILAAGDVVRDVAFPVAELTGAVLVAPDATPLPSARVSASSGFTVDGLQCSGGDSANTGTDGTFSGLLMLGGSSGSANVSSAPGGPYEGGTASFSVPVSGTVDVTLELVPLTTYTVSGVVTGYDGALVPGLSLYWYGPRGGHSVTTGSDGSYSFQTLPDSYTVYIDAFDGGGPIPDSLSCSIQSVAVSEDMTYDIAFPVVEISGQVTNASAIPIGGVRVSGNSGASANGMSCSGSVTVHSGDDGNYALRLLKGNASFSFTPPSGSGYLAANISTTLTGDLHQQLVLQLPDIVAPSITSGPFVIHHSNTSVSIQWATNEVTDAALAYEAGDALTGAEETVDAPAFTSDHIITLADLAPATQYAFQVTGHDGAGNAVSSVVLTFTTHALPDAEPPTITSGPVVTYLAPTQVIVAWTTDEPADSHVAFGLAGGALDGAKADAAYVLAHAVLLTGLTPEQSYTLVVRSSDPDGNGPTVAPPLDVTTPGEADLTPPVIGELRTECVTDTRMAVCWETDEAASSNATYTAPGGAATTLQNAALVTSRCLTLSGLAAGTSYSISVSSADGGGNAASAGPLVQTTASSAEEVTPVLSAVTAVATGPTSAVVTWHTEAGTSSLVYFGADPAALDRSAGDVSATVTEHRVVLTGLTAGAVTYVRATSTDPCQQRGESEVIAVVDVDECAEGTAGCATDASCENTFGGFTCTCYAGFHGDGVTCDDDDECAEGSHDCDANAHCTNLTGGFMCMCKDGYAGDGTSCADVDECATNNGGCDANATCTNSDG
ncbi:MAG: hypothetical protein CVU56_20140, partial [Deltaproteobacteria bacterium HGW-Deltaproteobacteria-14]